MAHEPLDALNLPTVLTAAGLTPTPPSVLRSQLIEAVARTNPGYTANLPGTLIEDIASTDTQALVMIDLARVEALNSLTPYGCNEFVLILLGKVYGVQIGQPTNTSVYVVFTGTPGLVIGKGFTVSDGSFQYVVQDGGVVAADGQTLPLYCVSPTSGTWAVPAGSVTAINTPPPTGFTLSVTNPLPGIPATSAETATQYRSRVLRAGLAASQGMARYLRTLLSNVPGVQDRLIGIQQQAEPNGGWLIIVGGGDPYVVAYTIYQALFDISTLVLSQINLSTITQANPAVATTDLDHGLSAGDDITVAESDPVAYDGNFAVIAAPTPTTFSYGTRYTQKAITSASWAGGVLTYNTASPHGMTSGSTAVVSGFTPAAYNGTFVATVTGASAFTRALVADPGADTVLGVLEAGIANFDSSALAPYVDSGFISPNSRNREITITDYPDDYLIRFVVPPQQSVTATVTWNTNSPFFVSPVAISNLAAQPLADYINSINVGKPINVLQMSDVFQNAVVSILPPAYLTALTFQIAINGVGKTVVTGTHIVEGDPQSFFFSTALDFNIVQGGI